MDLVDLKRRFEQADSVAIDSRGRFMDEENFGDCGVFVILKQIEQPLKYVSFDINMTKNEPAKKKSKEVPKTSPFMNSIRIVEQRLKEEQSQRKKSVKFRGTDPQSTQLATDKSHEHLRDNEHLHDIYNASFVTTRSKQLHVVNAASRNELFGLDDVLYEWSGQIFSKLDDGEMLFAKSLLNLPFGNQTSKDHSVLSLFKSLVGTKEMFLGWDLRGPFEFAELPNTVINEILRKDFESFLNGLVHSVGLMERVHARLQRGSRRVTIEARKAQKLEPSQFDNCFDYWKGLVDWFQQTTSDSSSEIKLNDQEKQTIFKTKNIIDEVDYEAFFAKFKETTHQQSSDHIEQIYFSQNSSKKHRKQKKSASKKGSRANRVHQIESEYLVFKNKTQGRSLYLQILRIVSRIWPQSPLNAHRGRTLFAVLRHFEQYIAGESLYFFVLGNVILGNLGTNWLQLPAGQLRQALLALSCNFLGQELEDNLLLNLIHLLMKTLLKSLFDDRVGAEELGLIRKINEFEALRDEEIRFESRRIDKQIAKQNPRTKKRNFLESSKKLNLSMQSFNFSARSSGNRLFRISGKNNNVLRQKDSKRKAVKQLRVKCEESLREHYLQVAANWRAREVHSDFQSSILAELLRQPNFHTKILDKLRETEFPMFLIFKNIFIVNLLHYFHLRRGDERRPRLEHVPKHHHLRSLRAQISSRIGGWPFEVNMRGLKTVGRLGANVVQNLVQGYERPVEQKQSIFSKLVNMVGKLMGDQRDTPIEINVDGKDIQEMVRVARRGIEQGNRQIWPMVQAFPTQFALTDIFYNQIGLASDSTMPYFLHVQARIGDGLVGRAVQTELFYRVESRFSECMNNEGNRYYLKKLAKTKYGIGERKCGRRGCVEELSRKVSVREYSFRDIRKKLKIQNEGTTNIPAGRTNSRPGDGGA